MVGILTQQAVAKQWYAAPDGKPVAEGGAGTMQSPWGLVTAMKHQAAIKPGDTVWFREGTYFVERVDNVANEVAVDLSEYLKTGAAFEVRDPKNFFGDALITGEYAGDALNVPVPGKFGAFIVVVKP